MQSGQSPAFISAEHIARQLGKGKERGHGAQWSTLCPLHGDDSPSLSVKETNGKILIYCHSGCKNTDVIKELDRIGLWPKKAKSSGRGRKPRQPIEQQWKEEGLELQTIYPYFDERNNLLYQCCRLWDTKAGRKTFRQRVPDGEGDWYGSLGSVRRVLYNLPEVLKAIKQDLPIYIVEGEKDVETLRAQGVVATCNVAGSAAVNAQVKWLPEYTATLLPAKHLYIIPDNDYAGYNHLINVGKSFKESGKNIQVVELPGVALKGDVSDWLEDFDIETFEVLKDSAFDFTEELQNPHPKPEPKRKQKAVQEDEQDSNVVRINEDAPIQIDFEAFTDSGNANRFVERYGQDVKYCGRLGWLIWNECRFKIDKKEAVNELAKDTARQIIHETHLAEPKQLIKFCQSSLNREGISSMLASARSKPQIGVELEEFDADIYMFNTKNSILDLRNGKSLEHDRKYLCTKVAATEFDPDAECLNWMAFLDTITDSDLEMQTFLQKVAGCMLSGDISLQKFFICYGEGQNGKSVFINTLTWLLGDYSVAPRSRMFMKKQTETQQDNLSQLVGARLIAVSEIDSSDRLDEQLIKDITGGDPLQGRFLFNEPFYFQTQGKLLFRCNYLPRIVDMDKGIWRRVVVIPFNVTIKDEDRNDQLDQQLKAEYPGILNWMFEGYQLLKEEGLKLPQLVSEANNQYKATMDTLGTMLEERCNNGDMYEVHSKDLYGCYVQFCTENGFKPMNATRLGMAMRQKGFQVRRTNNGKIYIGIDLKPEFQGKSYSSRHTGGLFTTQEDD